MIEGLVPDPRDTDRATAKKAAMERADNDLRFVMADARGRHFVWRQLADAGVFRSTFAVEPLAMAYAEGKRAVGLELLARLMRVCPDDYLTAQKENMRDNS